MRLWTTDWSYNDFFNRLRFSANFALWAFSEIGSLAIKVPKIRDLGDVLAPIGAHHGWGGKGHRKEREHGRFGKAASTEYGLA